MEHHSNTVPWFQVCERTGAVIKRIELNPDGTLRLDDLDKLITERTKLVAVTQQSNVLGTINPVRLIADAAHRKGAVILVDGAQSVPHMPVDVQALDCDFFVFSGHKMCGPTASGILYGPAGDSRSDAAVHGRRRDDQGSLVRPREVQRSAL